MKILSEPSLEVKTLRGPGKGVNGIKRQGYRSIPTDTGLAESSKLRRERISDPRPLPFACCAIAKFDTRERLPQLWRVPTRRSLAEPRFCLKPTPRPPQKKPLSAQES